MSYTTSGTTSFIQGICNDVRRGYGVVPFIGSGVSAASGILMGQEFTHFLAHCVYSSLHVGENGQRWNIRRDGWPKYPTSNEVSRARKWIFERFSKICAQHGWKSIQCDNHSVPMVKSLRRSQPTTSDSDIKIRDINLELTRPLVPLIIRHWKMGNDDKELKRTQVLLNIRQAFACSAGLTGNETRITSEDQIVDIGIMSLHDWRSSLDFLSRLEGGIDHDEKHLSLGNAEQSVIDGFNVHITAGKQPNLGHKSLVNLIRPLRIRTLLTTNFDSLLEETCANLKIPIEVFEVGIGGNLPHWRTVKSRASIIKLHGGMFDTRADYSLDEGPAQRELDEFANYLLPIKTGSQHNQLLVVGYSGSDNRCIQMIKHTLDMAPALRIYWVCFSEGDVHHVKQLFREYKGRVVTQRTDRPDLLLYELYQELTLALPGGGFSYQFTHKAPPERVGQKQSPDSGEEKIAQEIVRAFKTPADREAIYKSTTAAVYASYKCYEVGESFPISTATPLIVDIGTGATGAMRASFELLQTQHWRKCIWLELEDYSNPLEMLQDLFRTIAVRLGFYQLEHTVITPILYGYENANRVNAWWKERVVALANHMWQVVKYMGFAADEYYVFLYGRNGAGGCAGWDDAHWTKKEFRDLKWLISVLAAIGFRIVYLPMTHPKKERFNAQQEHILTKNWQIGLDSIMGTHSPNDERSSEHTAFIKTSSTCNIVDMEADPKVDSSLRDRHAQSFERILDQVLAKWLFEDGNRRYSDADRGEIFLKMQFLYASTLFRQSRHTTALFSESSYPCPRRFNAGRLDNDWARSNKVKVWVSELSDEGVFYRKPGGHAWKHRATRIGIQKAIESVDLRNVAFPDKRSYDFAGQIRAKTHFLIADWYRKVFYSTGHWAPLVESLYHRFQCIKYVSFAKPSRLRVDNTEPVRKYRLHLLQSALGEANKTLLSSRSWLKFWLQSSNGSTLFSKTSRLAAKSSQSGDAQKFLSEENCNNQALVLVANQVDRFSSECDLDSDSILMKRFHELFGRILSLNGSLKAEAGNLQGKSLRAFANAKTVTDMPHVREGTPITHNEDAICGKEWREKFDAAIDLSFGTNRLSKIFRDYDSGFIECDKKSKKRLRKDKMRRLRRNLTRALPVFKADWILTNETDNKQSVAQGISMLGEYAYAHIKRAKIEAHSQVGIDWQPPDKRKKIIDWSKEPGVRATKRLWVQATAICYLSLDLCNNLPSTLQRFEYRQKVKAHALYGLSLGNLGRFFEARRHFGEAAAILTKSVYAVPDVQFAILNLRRAETYLAEARQLARFATQSKQLDATGAPERKCLSFLTDSYPEWYLLATKRGNDITELDADSLMKASEDAQRLHFALIDDAWMCLEAAETQLSGKSHSSLWWGRLITLRIRLYGEHMPIGESRVGTIAMQRPVQHDNYILQLYETGKLAASASPYRRIRLIDYTINALRKIDGQLTPQRLEDLKRLDADVDDCIKELDRKSEIRTYAELVKQGTHEVCKRLKQEL